MERLLDLNALQTFVAVVRAGGFAAAARQAGIPRSTVSLRIRNLEEALRVRLFKRSTRSFAPTVEGTALYQRSADALMTLNDAIAGLTTPDAYAGEIHLTAPADFPSSILAAAIGDYRDQYPNVRFEVLPTNEVLDLVSENIDIALRIGAANPQDALVKGAINMDFGFYASAQYLKRHGIPSDIRAASTLIGPLRPDLLRLLTAALQEGTALPRFHVAVDSFMLVRELVLRHNGIGLLPGALCAPERASRSVLPVLPDRFSGSIRLHVTYPSRADLSPKVAAFARILERYLTPTAL
jgi:DNA-binding transcriptional LysR family regulator